MATTLNSKFKDNWLKAALMAAVVLVSAFALTACGNSEEEKTGIVEGEPVHLGPLEYNVLFTRPLNKSDVEDSQYLADQPFPKPGTTYIGVFVKIENTDEDEAHRLPEGFKIITTTGKSFETSPAKAPTSSSRGPRFPRVETSRSWTRRRRWVRSRHRCCST